MRTTPQTPEQLTPLFLSQILAHDVVARTIQRIGQDEGFTGGSLFRITPTYRRATQDAPRSIVAKFSPADPEMRRRFATANHREVAFYADLSAGKALPVPVCFFASFDPATQASLLILQDLGDLRSVSFLAGCSAADAMHVAQAMARIHATFWNHPILSSLNGAAILHEFSFRDAWRAYPEKVAALLPNMQIPDSFLALGQFISQHEEAVFDHLMEQPPLTLAHRDLQVDNIMFSMAEGDEASVILDWQIVGKGRGVSDLAYFLISSLEPDTRRTSEGLILETYHGSLLRNGVADYDFAACKRDYRTAVITKIFVTVGATVFMDNASPHKTAWRATDLRRLLAFCQDHDLSEASFDFKPL
ncbi:MAG: phosphotransferase [Aestuariivita sp.]|uniref:phosphotransferase n=1 Tax=Aestuariivita sp. TaxID=1872407 RepID=UPI003BB002AF